MSLSYPFKNCSAFPGDARLDSVAVAPQLVGDIPQCQDRIIVGVAGVADETNATLAGGLRRGRRCRLEPPKCLSAITHKYAA
jgi:hypothetical protein